MPPGRNRPHAGPAARPPLCFFRSRRSSLSPISFLSPSLLLFLSVCVAFPLSPLGSVAFHFLDQILKWFFFFFPVLLFLFFSLSFLVDSHVRIQAPGPQRLPENRCAFLTSILLRKRAEWPGGGTFL